MVFYSTRQTFPVAAAGQSDRYLKHTGKIMLNLNLLKALSLIKIITILGLL
jgi:hypothetical protein